MKKWWQEKNKGASALRICVVPGFFVGVGLAIGGCVAMFFGKSDAAMAMGTGATIMSACMGAKAWQKKSEKGEGDE